MGRPSIRVKLTITLKDDDRFMNPRTFNSIPDASFATGLTDRGIREAYHSNRELMQKKSREVYDLKWEEPYPIKPQCVKDPAKKCAKCSKDLTPKNRSLWFFMYQEGDHYERPLTFISLYLASKITSISICALKNARSKANMTITLQRGGASLIAVPKPKRNLNYSSIILKITNF